MEFPIANRNILRGEKTWLAPLPTGIMIVPFRRIQLVVFELIGQLRDRLPLASRGWTREPGCRGVLSKKRDVVPGKEFAFEGDFLSFAVQGYLPRAGIEFDQIAFDRAFSISALPGARMDTGRGEHRDGGEAEGKDLDMGFHEVNSVIHDGRLLCSAKVAYNDLRSFHPW